MHSFRRNKKGFTAVETIVALGIFALFSAGVYTGIQYTFKSVYSSRIRILETALLNEQIELIRNIPYENVGIVNGSPAGVLQRTVTTTKSGIPFTITRTIRNIDDVFDGTIDGEIPDGKVAVCHNDTNTLIIGEPALAGHEGHGDSEGFCPGDENLGKDISPADYKLVDVSVICDSCGQQRPLSMTTLVAPKYLEGDPNNGALRIRVFENNYTSVVQGATVSITATSTSTTIDLVDTTDNDGELLLVDLPPGINAYHIVVTKAGYTTAMTTTSVANPIIPPASVISQNLQSISFEINPAASITLTTKDNLCAPVGSVGVAVQGERLIGTDPDTLLVNSSYTTGGSGQLSLSGLEPDDYSFQATSYDVIGAIPMLPLTVTAGTNYLLDLIVGPNSAHSLLVHVEDSTNGQPIPNATVRLEGGSTDETKTTGIGHSRQNDWSGGSGQSLIGNNDAYWNDDGNIDVATTPGNVTLAPLGGGYVSSGWLESSTFDVGDGVTYQTLDWQPFVQSAQTGDDSLRFQLASSSSTSPSAWDFVGPDGTPGTYYTPSSVDIYDGHDGDQYMRYRAFFQTASSTYSPLLSDFAITYTNSCTPPGQAYFGSLAAQSYTATISADGYETATSSVSVSGDTFFSAPLIAQ